MSDSGLIVQGMSGGYSAAPVLRDVDLEVRGGEIVAIFGANGAGKTSLLRALSGTLPRCVGSITLDGTSLADLSIWKRARLGLSHVPEGRHIFGPMTVRENLEAGGLRTKSSAMEQTFDLFPKLRERQQQLAGSLSGGEQQMLAIGRALMARPSVMLLDEMSAGLAPVITQRLVDSLCRIRDEGVAVLLVEQAPHFVADVVDRAYLVEQGRIVAHGSLDELGGVAAIGDHYLGLS